MRRHLRSLGRIFETGVINFIRNIGLSVAAMSVMFVTLTIVLLSFVANVAFTNTIAQITNQIGISVFLKDSDTPAQTNTLLAEVKRLPNVKSIQYLNKTQALAQYEQQNTANKQLANAVDVLSNPIPATIIINPVNLNKIQDIKNFLVEPNVAALQSDSPTYSGEREVAINKITHATNILREVGILSIVIFTIISVLIIFNTIQMAIFNRRDEIKIMRLLGASTAYIRGPFVVESALYGLFSGTLSTFIIYGAFKGASSSLQASSLGLLNISYAANYFDNHFLLSLAAMVMLGILLGAGSSFIATIRYLKFKTK